jgi:hydrogenase expression/formation protein HypC
MCLSVPGRIVEVFRDGDVRMAKVAFGGVAKAVCVEHVPEAGPGDYVLVHVGFALACIDEKEANRVLSLLLAMGEEREGGGP